MGKEKTMNLTIGSKYRITSLGTKEEALISIGLFKGYIVFGNMDGLCLELAEGEKEYIGKIRIIPSHMVLAIDIIEAVEQKTKEEEETSARYYH
ncbi:MAG: hypothetical protein AB1779_05110 [Candidatus Thermoplasmatota archaeon]